jgi:hypothetical protein
MISQRSSFFPPFVSPIISGFTNVSLLPKTTKNFSNCFKVDVLTENQRRGDFVSPVYSKNDTPFSSRYSILVVIFDVRIFEFFNVSVSVFGKWLAESLFWFISSSCQFL